MSTAVYGLNSSVRLHNIRKTGNPFVERGGFPLAKRRLGQTAELSLHFRRAQRRHECTYKIFRRTGKSAASAPGGNRLSGPRPTG
jgi:hypothetical protein